MPNDSLTRSALDSSSIENAPCFQFPAGLVSKLAHDLRTPLGVVQGFSQLILEQERLDPAMREYVEMIRDSGSQLRQRIESYVEVMQSCAGATDQSADEFRLVDLLCDELRSAAGERGINIVDEGGTATRISGNERRMRVLLGHLLACTTDDSVLKTQLFLEQGQRGIVGLTLLAPGPTLADSNFEHDSAARHPAAVHLAFCLLLCHRMGGRVDEVRSGVGELSIRVPVNIAGGASTSVPTGRSLSRARIPALLAAELRQAADRGDSEGVELLLPAIAAQSPELAKAVARLVQAFDYDAIVELASAGGDLR